MKKLMFTTEVIDDKCTFLFPLYYKENNFHSYTIDSYSESMRQGLNSPYLRYFASAKIDAKEEIK
tara:strand:+ start:164 stop:358 length:195 start_codon:yes stop_codon:yes gene_type:complete